MTGSMMSGGMMGHGSISGFSWMWIPTLLTLGLVVLLGWLIFGTKKFWYGPLVRTIFDGISSAAPPQAESGQ